MHHDRGGAHVFLLHQPEQHGGVVWHEPHAAVGNRPAQIRGFMGPMDGNTAVEEDRVRHR